MGCAKGCHSAVMVTLGTGVGGGVIVNGKIIEGAHGAGGEIGHITVNPHETAVCGCGKHGCLEQYSSATGVVRCMKKLLDENPDTPAPCAAPTLPPRMSLMPPVQAMHWPPVRWTR